MLPLAASYIDTLQMRKKNLLNFTFIADFRGGTYCSQVQAENVNKSTIKWVEQIASTKQEIPYLGDKIIAELKVLLKDKNKMPVPLDSLKNVWFLLLSTKQGSIFINIIKTDIL